MFHIRSLFLCPYLQFQWFSVPSVFSQHNFLIKKLNLLNYVFSPLCGVVNTVFHPKLPGSIFSYSAPSWHFLLYHSVCLIESQSLQSPEPCPPHKLKVSIVNGSAEQYDCPAVVFGLSSTT